MIFKYKSNKEYDESNNLIVKENEEILYINEYITNASISFSNNCQISLSIEFEALNNDNNIYLKNFKNTFNLFQLFENNLIKQNLFLELNMISDNESNSFYINDNLALFNFRYLNHSSKYSYSHSKISVEFISDFYYLNNFSYVANKLLTNSHDVKKVLNDNLKLQPIFPASIKDKVFQRYYTLNNTIKNKVVFNDFENFSKKDLILQALKSSLSEIVSIDYEKLTFNIKEITDIRSNRFNTIDLTLEKNKQDLLNIEYIEIDSDFSNKTVSGQGILTTGTEEAGNLSKKVYGIQSEIRIDNEYEALKTYDYTEYEILNDERFKIADNLVWSMKENILNSSKITYKLPRFQLTKEILEDKTLFNEYNKLKVNNFIRLNLNGELMLFKIIKVTGNLKSIINKDDSTKRNIDVLTTKEIEIEKIN